MRKRYEFTTMGAEKKEKNSVSWVDGNDNGQIDQNKLTISPSFSPKKEVLNQQIAELQKEGYTELEATALVGKSATPSGEVIINNPIFYASTKEIQQQKLLREKPVSGSKNATPTGSTSTVTKEEEEVEYSINYPPSEGESNRYSFFNSTSIGLGLTALAAAATIGFVATRK